MANFIFEDLKNTFRQKNNGLVQLIVVNVVVFVLVNIFIAILLMAKANAFLPIDLLALPANFSKLLVRFWTPFTYMFLHEGFFHILFNMIWLYWLGKIQKEYLGDRSVISTYILGGLAGGLLFIPLYNLFHLIAPGTVNINAPLLGASAGVMAVVFASATLLPNFTIRLFLIGNVRLKYLALGALVLTSIIDFSSNTGGKIAHLGGAIYGYLYIKNLQKGNDWSKIFYGLLDNITGYFYKKKKMRVAYKRPKSDTKHNADMARRQEKIDTILDKISKSGYESLTKEEKDFLFRASNKK
ncbi:rhomboid family intramembrane serine protease [Bacteroidales bacterium AH-315-I05]|nr:rhomboid family intramembrane serine protease [Bacteroidales bacterium AH-315-I05]